MQEEEEEEEALGQIKGSALLCWISHTNNPFKVTFLGLSQRISVAGGVFFSHPHTDPSQKGILQLLGPSAKETGRGF